MSITKYISTGFEVGESFNSPTKTAAWQPERYVPPEIEEFVHSLEPDPRFSYVHLIAMTDGDWYGQNLNGDIFDEDQLLGLQTPEEALKNQGDLRGVAVPRYQTFQQAKFYRKHRNSPTSPFYGDVPCVAWNAPMRRVELIVRIAKEAIPDAGMEKAPDIVLKLDRRGFITVSMGCFGDPDTPIRTVDGYTRLADVKVGDLVATHKGRWRRVTGLHQRKYTGPMATVRIKGLPRPLMMTADHPLLAKHQNQAVAAATSRLSQRQWAKTGTLQEVEDQGWSRVAELHPGDLVFHAGIQEGTEAVGLTAQQARFLAYYLADGSLSDNPTGPSTVSWCLNSNNPAKAELFELCQALAGKDPVPDEHKTSEHATILRLYHTETARWTEALVGRAASKHLPAALYSSPVQVRLAFAGAWLACDGHRDYKGCHFSMSQEFRALALRDLLFSCGVSSTLHKIHHPAGRGFNQSDTTEYVVSIQRDQALALVPWCYKLEGLPDEVQAQSASQSPYVKPLPDGNFAAFVTDIKWTMVSDITVYNLEVEDDESYLAAGIVSHNCNIAHETCSYCDAANKFIKDRCSHLKNQMGQIMPNGVRVGARNYGMRFFDISDVDIPADDTAFSLQKVAGIVVNEAFDTLPEMKKAAAWLGKWAAIKKQISLQPGCLGELTPKPAKTGEMEAFTTGELDGMIKAAAGDLDAVLSTAALAGIVFQPAELMHLTKVACGDTDDFAGFQAISLDRFSLPVYHAIRSKIASRSCFTAPCPAVGWEPAKVAEQGFPELADYYRFYRDAINCLPKQSFIKAAMRIGPLQGLHGGDLAKIDAGVRGLVHAGMADDSLPPSP